MADSVGGGFPTTNIQVGHIFCDRDDLTLWKYLGGDPRLASSWLLFHGQVSQQPDTTLWGTAQAGAVWFNTADRTYYGWNGSQLVPMAWRYSPSLSNYKIMSTVWDDFQQGAGASGSLGKLGWVATGTVISSEANRPGLYRFDTGAGASTIARLSPHSSNSFNPDVPFEITWVIRVNTPDNATTVRFGSGNSVAANPPNNGIYFEKLTTDTTWTCVCRASLSQTRVVTAVPVDTNFVTLKLVRSTAGVVFTINNVVVATITTNIPSAAGSGGGIAPYGFIINPTGGSKTFDVDYFEMVLQGLQR